MPTTKFVVLVTHDDDTPENVLDLTLAIQERLAYTTCEDYGATDAERAEGVRADGLSAPWVQGVEVVLDDQPTVVMTANNYERGA